MDGCWLPRQVVLEERVSQRAAHYLMTLTPDDLKKYNPPSKHHCKTEDEFKAAHEKLRVFLNACVGKAGGVQRTYRYAQGKDFGRMFCSEGIQNVWRAFRGALCEGLMTDIDMKNCHPVILVWLCEKFAIDCPKLREYVTAREHHLAELGKVLQGKVREHCKLLRAGRAGGGRRERGAPRAAATEDAVAGAGAGLANAGRQP